MDLSGPQSLKNILQAEELQLVPDNIQTKLSAYIEQFSDEYCKERAAANRLSKYIYIYSLLLNINKILCKTKPAYDSMKN